MNEQPKAKKEPIDLHLIASPLRYIHYTRLSSLLLALEARRDGIVVSTLCGNIAGMITSRPRSRPKGKEVWSPGFSSFLGSSSSDPLWRAILVSKFLCDY